MPVLRPIGREGGDRMETMVIDEKTVFSGNGTAMRSVTVESVQPLFRAVFGQKAEATLKAIWKWKYYDPPYRFSGEPVMFIAEHNHEVVGFIGTLPARIKLGDRVAPMSWCVDFSVLPKFRGRGISLLRQFMNAFPEAAKMGTPIDRSHGLGKKLGFVDVAELVGCRMVLRPYRVFRLKGKGKTASAVLSAVFFAASLPARALFGVFAPKGLTVREIKSFDSSFDEFWESVKNGYDAIVVRDSAFLNWRFFSCPHKRYTVLTAERKGKTAGYIVYRTSEENGLKKGFIADFLVDEKDPAALSRLVSAAVLAMRREKVDLVMTAVTDARDSS
jgi:GNAT superfamily N-acetyltransferase